MQLRAAEFLSFSLDEATDISVSSLMAIHGYLVNSNFEREVVLVEIPQIKDAPNAQTLLRVFSSSILSCSGLGAAELANKVVARGSDGAPVLQGVDNGVLKAFTMDFAPHCVPIWCYAHRLNLAAAAMLTVALVAKLQKLAATTHTYYARSALRTSELARCASDLGTPGRKPIEPAATRWLSLEKPLKNVLDDYPAHMRNTFDTSDPPRSDCSALELYEMLADADVCLGVPALLPMLGFLQVCALPSVCACYACCVATRFMMLHALSAVIRACMCNMCMRLNALHV